MAKTNPEMIINEIQDIYLRRNFLQLDNYFKSQNQLLDFKFFEVKFTATTLNQKVNHGLKFIPRDVVFLGATNNATVSFNIGVFNLTNLDITANKETTLRFFVGKYFGNTTVSQPEATDVLLFGPDLIVATNSKSTGEITASNMGSAGQVVMFAGTSYPSKSLLCDGSRYATKDYPKLAFALWDKTTSRYAFGGDGAYPNGSFNVPDMRGLIPRGVTKASTNDPDSAARRASGSGGNIGNNVGSVQDDAFQGHWHAGPPSVPLSYAAGGGTIANSTSVTTPSSLVRNPITDGTNGTPRTASETRPRNLYFNYIIMTE